MKEKLLEYLTLALCTSAPIPIAILWRIPEPVIAQHFGLITCSALLSSLFLFNLGMWIHYRNHAY